MEHTQAAPHVVIVSLHHMATVLTDAQISSAFPKADIKIQERNHKSRNQLRDTRILSSRASCTLGTGSEGRSFVAVRKRLCLLWVWRGTRTLSKARSATPQILAETDSE